MTEIERRDDIPKGKPTELGWALSCSGVHPEAVKIVEGLQSEVERLSEELAKVESVLVAADRVREAYDAMLEGRKLGPLPDFEKLAPVS